MQIHSIIRNIFILFNYLFFELLRVVNFIIKKLLKFFTSELRQIIKKYSYNTRKSRP